MPAVCGIKRSSRNDEFTAEEVALFEAVVPHLVRAVDIQRRLQHLELAREAALAAGEREHSCIILLDGTGKSLQPESAAKRILDARDGLRIENGRVSADEPAASAALERLIDGCVHRGRARGASGGSVMVPRGRDRTPLHVEVAPVPIRGEGVDAGWLGLRSPAAVLAITDPERKRELAKERLRKRFGLTPAETELAVEIANGDGRKAAAARLGISVGTSRTHLMRIFDKTGVRRQAELVRLIFECSGSCLR